MPSTRARTSAVRTACTRPGSVMTLVTGCARIVTIPTSGGGGGGGASLPQPASVSIAAPARAHAAFLNVRSEEHTSELQSLMRISYAVFCLKKKNNLPKTLLVREYKK